MPDLDAAFFLNKLKQYKAGAHVALAVSGGADSMGLLALAAEARHSPDAPRFSVLSVDHGLRAAAADEIAAVAQACVAVGLPHVALTADAPLADSNLQEQARWLRYRLMAAWCAANGATSVVTAHHRQDQAETVLMRLARGAGVNGLSGMAAAQNLRTVAGPLRLVRPLLANQPEQLRYWAEQAGFPTAEDASNHDRKFERVRWRQALPHMAEVGLTVDALAGLADEMRHIRGQENRALLDWMKGAAHWHGYGVLRLDGAAYRDLSAAMRQRLVTAVVSYFGQLPYPPKTAALQSFAAAPQADHHGGATLGGTQMRWRRDKVFFGRETAAAPKTAMATGTLEWDGRVALQAKPGVKIVDGLNVAALGRRGVQQMRDAGAIFDETVPACYHTALAGIFAADRLLGCPQLASTDGLMTDFTVAPVQQVELFRDILGGGQDW